ncbi:MAG: bifunctional diguanylate cyclase/phosphodiesterase [Marinomonas sp.]
MHLTFSKILARPKQASSIVFALSLLIFGAIALEVLQKQKHASESIALSLAQSHASLLQTALDKSLSANYALAAIISEKQGQMDWFPSFAASLKVNYPDVANFALSPNGVVQQVFPLEGNKSVLGFDILSDEKQGPSARKAQIEDQFTLSGPFNLVQGGRGIVGLLPVYLLGEAEQSAVFWGFSSVVIRLNVILNYVNFSNLESNGFDYQLIKLNPIEGGKSSLIVASNETLDPSYVKASIDVPNAEWQLVVFPKNSWLPLWSIIELFSVVLLASIFLSRWFYLALKMRQSKESLEVVVARRTAQLSNSNLRMKAILAAMPDSFYEVGEDGVVVEYHSPRMDKWYKKVDWVIGKHFTELLSEESIIVVEKALAEAKEQGYSNSNEYFFDFDEERRWFDISTTYSCEPNGTNGFYILLSRDITQRKKIDAELRIAAIAFQTQDGILITDKEDKILRVNEAFEKITGYTEAEVLGHTPSIISSGRHPKSFYQQMHQRLKSHECWEGEVWNRRKNGEIFPEWLSISVVKDDNGEVTQYVATLKDITEDKANERRINQLNYYDSLTRLPNRRMVTEEINTLLEHIDLRHRRSAILFIDLDHFKDINDLKGHNLGDILLQQVASRLMDSTRSGDSVARFSGDEFIIMLEDVDISLDADCIVYRAKHVASKIMSALRRPFELNGEYCSVTASVGISIFGQDVISSSEIIKQAEMAMYEAKGYGRNHVCFYAPQMHEKILERLTLDNSFRAALQNQDFVLYYQPQWNSEQGMVGVEALVRWLHKDKGMISPGVFIPFAEESKLILPLGRWVMRTAMTQLAKWHQTPKYSNLIMSINVSVLQFSHVDFVSEVKSALAETKANPAFIQLELTESMLVRDQLDIIQKMQSLKKLGVLISLDDFGTGYSSLSYLQQLPIDQLKIDQSFTRAIEESEKQASLAASIIGLGHNLGMEVIAEGVETQEQLEWLKSHGCDLYQGFLLARPQPSDAF